MRTRPLFAVAMCAFAALAACGGGSSPGPVGPPAPASSPSVSQTSLSFTRIGAAPPQTVTVSNFAGPVAVSVTDPLIVSVTPAGLPSGSGTLTVNAVATGSTSIVLSDGVNAPVSVAVLVTPCLPPVPGFVQADPADKATNVSTNAGRIVFGLVKSQQWTPAIVGQFGVRLIAANGGAVNGGLMAPSQPPATVPPALANDDWYAATIPALASGTTYRVQIVNPTDTCLPPFVSGTFST